MKKKEKFIYWFIGLGCGIMLSGIMITFVGLNLKPIDTSNMKQEQLVKEEKNQSPIEQSSTDKPLVADQEVLVDRVAEEEKSEKDYKWVDIPSEYSATQISRFLEAEGIVEDSMGFRDYIVEKKKTTKLRTGRQYLPITGEYDQILSILTTVPSN